MRIARKRCPWIVLLALCSLFLLGASSPFEVTLSPSFVEYIYGSLVQPSVVLANGSSLYIVLPLTYLQSSNLNQSVMNVSLDKPIGWENGFNWSVNESGILKTVTANGKLNWSANLSSSAVITFFVPPVNLTPVTEEINDTEYTFNFSVSSDNSFTNVSVNVSVNSNFSFWWLWWQNSSTWQDVTILFNFNVSGNYATFHGFSTPVQNFSLEGRMNCTETWSCTAWSGGSCGSRTCVDANRCGTFNNKPAESLACYTPPSGGGGGGGVTKKPGFIVEPVLIKVIMTEGEYEEHEVVVRNTGDTALDIAFTQQGLDELLTQLAQFEEFSFRLEKDARETFMLVFNAEGIEPGIHTGLIVFQGGGFREVLEVVVEVQSMFIIFDIDLEVPLIYTHPAAGDEIEVLVTIYNLIGVGRQDVLITYYITDMMGNIVLTDSETVAVETKATTRRTLQLPPILEPGSYVVGAEVSYNGQIGTSSHIIHVTGEGLEPPPAVFITPLIEKITSYLIGNKAGFLALIIVLVILFEIIVKLRMRSHITNIKLRRATSLIDEIEELMAQHKLDKAKTLLLELGAIYRELPRRAKRPIYKRTVEKLLKDMLKEKNERGVDLGKKDNNH